MLLERLPIGIGQASEHVLLGDVALLDVGAGHHLRVVH
jgi:hypothetical protein